MTAKQVQFHCVWKILIPFLIIDEKKGRRIAQELGVKITGTLGVILSAKEKGLVNSIEEVLKKLENVEFRISPSIKAKILESD